MNSYGQSHDNYNNQFNQNQFNNHRGSVRYGNNPYQVSLFIDYSIYSILYYSDCSTEFRSRYK